MTVDVSALSSLTATLHEVCANLAEINRATDEEEDHASDLAEIERQLEITCRRLDKATLLIQRSQK